MSWKETNVPIMDSYAFTTYKNCTKHLKNNQTYNCLGRYIFTPDIFEILNRVEPREDGEIHLHDALRLMLDRQTIYACRQIGHDDGECFEFQES